MVLGDYCLTESTHHIRNAGRILYLTALGIAWMQLLSTAHAEDPFEWLPDDVAKQGQFGEYAVDDSRYATETVLYRLFAPARAAERSTEMTYPLIVWLHGHGVTEFMKANYGNLLYIHNCVYADFDSPRDANFYLLAVQCPGWDRPWFGNQPKGSDGKWFIEPGEAVVRILDHVLSKEPIDRNRISIIGISTGANASWEMTMRYPDVFSAIAPISSAGGDVGRMSLIKHIPTWSFYNQNDTDKLKDGLNKTITALHSVGGICWSTGVSGDGIDNHDAWHDAFHKYALLKWLVDQKKGQSRLTSFAKSVVDWDDKWPAIATGAAFAFFVIFVTRAIRRAPQTSGDATGVKNTSSIGASSEDEISPNSE